MAAEKRSIKNFFIRSFLFQPIKIAINSFQFGNKLIYLHGNRGSSSVGRALASQAEGRGIVPRLPLFITGPCPEPRRSGLLFSRPPQRPPLAPDGAFLLSGPAPNPAAPAGYSSSPAIVLQRTQLTVRDLCKVIPLKKRGITLRNELSLRCVHCSGSLAGGSRGEGAQPAKERSRRRNSADEGTQPANGESTTRQRTRQREPSKSWERISKRPISAVFFTWAPAQAQIS